MFAGVPHFSVESIRCSTFVGYSCMHLRLYLLPFRLSQVQWVLGTHTFPLICFGFGRLFLAWPIYLALFCKSPTGPITVFCMTNGLGLFGGLPTCIGDLFATKLRRALGFAGFTASWSALGFGGIRSLKRCCRRIFAALSVWRFFVVSANGRTSGSSAWLP